MQENCYLVAIYKLATKFSNSEKIIIIIIIGFRNVGWEVLFD